MKKAYRISFLTYSGMLFFSILFMLMLLGASGHKVIFNLSHYLIAIYPIINILLLFIFPRITVQKSLLKIIIGITVLIFLLVSFYYALQNLYSILNENLIIEFKTIATIFLGFFIGTIIYLFKEIILELKTKKLNP
jgi:hypothetical protein